MPDEAMDLYKKCNQVPVEYIAFQMLGLSEVYSLVLPLTIINVLQSPDYLLPHQ